MRQGPRSRSDVSECPSLAFALQLVIFDRHLDRVARHAEHVRRFGDGDGDGKERSLANVFRHDIPIRRAAAETVFGDLKARSCWGRINGLDLTPARPPCNPASFGGLDRKEKPAAIELSGRGSRTLRDAQTFSGSVIFRRGGLVSVRSDATGYLLEPRRADNLRA